MCFLRFVGRSKAHLLNNPPLQLRVTVGARPGDRTAISPPTSHIAYFVVRDLGAEWNQEKALMGWESVFEQADKDKAVGEQRLQAALLRASVIGEHWQELWERVVSLLRDEVPKLNSQLRVRSILCANNDLVFIPQGEHCYSISNPAMPRVEMFLRCVPSQSIQISGWWQPDAYTRTGIGPLRINFAVDGHFRPCLRSDNEEFGAASAVEGLLSQIASRFAKTVGAL